MGKPERMVQRLSGVGFQLCDELGMDGVFDQLSESMLLLGAAGAGKTTQLLDLAEGLVAKARTDERSGIPVMVDLADWSRSAERGFWMFRRAEGGPRDFVEWLLGLLAKRYGIPEGIGRTWLYDNQLTLLLDGLDEVRERDRERCVEEINQLQSTLGVTRLAVCSRDTDYRRLDKRLRLQGAVVIRPLTKEQVTGYLERVSHPLTGIAAALSDDEQPWELLTTPLMLDIMVLAQDNPSWRALAESGDAAERRRLLFDAYLVEVLARTRRVREPENSERTLRALHTLAVASAKLSPDARMVRLDLRAFLDNDLEEPIVAEPVVAVLACWLVPTVATVWMLACVATMSVRFSVVAGLGAAVLGWFVFRETGLRDTAAGIARIPALLGYLLAVLASVVGLLLGLSWLLEAHATATAIAIGLLPIVLLNVVFLLSHTAYVWIVLWPELLRDGWRENWWLVLPGAVVAGAVLLLRTESAALDGFSVGVVQGIGIGIVAVFDPKVSPGFDRSAYRRRPIKVMLYMLASVTASVALARLWRRRGPHRSGGRCWAGRWDSCARSRSRLRRFSSWPFPMLASRWQWPGNRIRGGVRSCGLPWTGVCSRTPTASTGSSTCSSATTWSRVTRHVSRQPCSTAGQNW